MRHRDGLGNFQLIGIPPWSLRHMQQGTSNTLAAYQYTSVLKHTSQHGNANAMSLVQLCTSPRESPIPAKTDFADPVQDHMLLLSLMLILCCQHITMYHSYCLDFLLFCSRFTRSCKHVIRTPLMFTSCNMTSSILSHRVGARASPFTGEASCESDSVCTPCKASATMPAIITGQLLPLLTKRRLRSSLSYYCLSNVLGDVVTISNLHNNDFAGNHHSSGSPI